MLFDPQPRIFWEGLHLSGWYEPGRYIYDCELVMISEGSCNIHIAGRRCTLHEDELIILPPGVWHKTHVPQRARRHCLHFDWTPRAEMSESPLQCNQKNGYQKELEHSPPHQILACLPLQQKADAVLVDLFQELLASLRATDQTVRYRLWGVLRRIIDNSQQWQAGNVNKTSHVAMLVKDVIESRYAEDLKYEDFCEVSRLSKCHLCNVFSSLLGMPPMAYLTHVRLEQAVRFLVESNLNVAEIARCCGIQDPNYFSRVFRKKYGMSPREFVRRKQK